MERGGRETNQYPADRQAGGQEANSSKYARLQENLDLTFCLKTDKCNSEIMGTIFAADFVTGTNLDR